MVASRRSSISSRETANMSEYRRSIKNADDDSSCAISFECHDSLIFDELSALVDKMDQEEEAHPQEAARDKKMDHGSADDIINTEIVTKKLRHNSLRHSNRSSNSLLSIVEDESPKEDPFGGSSSLVHDWETRIIHKYMKSGRLRRVVSSTDALDRRRGPQEGSSRQRPRRIRTVTSFNNAMFPAAANHADTPASNATFDSSSGNHPSLRRSPSAVSAGRSLLGAPSIRAANPSAVSAGRSLLGDPSILAANPSAASAGRSLLGSPSSMSTIRSNTSPQQSANGQKNNRSANLFSKVSVEDFTALVGGHPGLPLARSTSYATSKSSASIGTRSTAKESCSSLL